MARIARASAAARTTPAPRGGRHVAVDSSGGVNSRRRTPPSIYEAGCAQSLFAAGFTQLISRIADNYWDEGRGRFSMRKRAMSIGAMVGAFCVVCFSPLVYFPLKKWLATRSMNELLAPFPRLDRLPVASMKLKNGGEFLPREAFAAKLPSGADATIVLGGWDRGTITVNHAATRVVQRVAGVVVASPSADWATSYRSPQLLLATPTDGGALIVWADFPTGDGLRRHLRELDEALGQARERLPPR
jgi:hypothetical protein